MEPQPHVQSIAGVFTPRLVARLHREGFEGTLRLHAGGATRVVYFRKGDIASAASNAEDDRMHNLLIREGRLTGPQVEMARSKQRPGASLGKVLIELGFLTPSELLQGARRQVRQILAACFALTEGTWQTVPGPLGPEVTNLGLPARRLIFDALMEAGDRRAIVREMGSMESVYQPTALLAEALTTLRLEPAMEEVARMIDGRATLREISSRTRLDDFTVSRIVLGLDILGLASLATRPEPAVASRPGRVIPVESDDDGAAEVAVQPAETAAPPATAAAVPIAAPTTSADRPAPAADRPATSTPFAPAPPATADAAMVRAEATGETIRLPAFAPPPAASPAADRELPLRSAEEAPAVSEEPPASPARSADEAMIFSVRSGRDDREPEQEPAPPTEAEPPMFRRDELPAFADAPHEEQPVWTINPETGEKVHEGPIELTFDGPLAPARSGRPGARYLLAIGLVIVVLAALAVSFYLRAPAPDSVGRPLDRIAGAPAPDSEGNAPAPDADRTAAPAATAEPDQRPPAGAADTPVEAPPAEPVVAAPAPAPAPATPPAETAHPAPTATAAGADTTAAPGPPTRPPAGADEPAATAIPAVKPAPGRSADQRLAAGQALLDAGDVPGAATRFSATLATLPADQVTLQLMIACEEATVRKARSALSPDDPLFVTPFAMQGRACHRLLWGIYPDRATAQAAVASVPPYFTNAGIKPVAISLGRLRGPS